MDANTACQNKGRRLLRLDDATEAAIVRQESSWTSSTSSLWLRSEPSSLNSELHGTLRLVAVYCRATPVSEVTQNYYAGP